MHAYTIIKVNKFPTSEDVPETGLETSHQLPLPGMDGDETAYTRFKKLGLSENEDFEKYKIEHEDLESIEGRLRGQLISSYIRIYSIFAYYKRDKDILIVGGKKKIWWRAYDRLHKAYPGLFETEKPEINLSNLRTGLEPKVIGGYFNELGIANVNAASIFGSSVGESEEWERYEEAGELNALLISVNYKGIPRSIMLTKERVVVLYSTPNELEDLEFLLVVNEMITKAEALAEKLKE